jgi:hypothetical protein
VSSKSKRTCRSVSPWSCDRLPLFPLLLAVTGLLFALVVSTVVLRTVIHPILQTRGTGLASLDVYWNKSIAKQSRVLWGRGEDIVIIGPAPKVQVELALTDRLYDWHWNRANINSYGRFWANKSFCIYMWRTRFPLIGERVFVWHWSCKPFITGMTLEMSCRRCARIIPMEIKSNELRWVANGSIFNRSRRYESSLDFLQRISCYVVSIVRLGGTSTSLCRSIIGSDPLTSSKLRVSTKSNEGENRNNECEPIHPDADWKRSKNAIVLFALSLLLFGYGLWFIQSAGTIKNISIVNIGKVSAGLIFVFVGWITLHSALDLRDC